MNTKIFISAIILCSSGILFAGIPANLRPPELTATDLARLSNLRFIKGRLPNIEGFRIEAYEVLFRDSKGVFNSLSGAPIPYKYEDQKTDDVGELLVALTEEKSAYEIIVVARNYSSNQRVRFLIKKKEDYVMTGSQQFTGESGGTVNDLMHIVTIGDHDAFTFHSKDQNPDSKPAAVVIRTYRKK
jgi:hypothetical protein